MSKAFHMDPLWLYLLPEDEKREQSVIMYYRYILSVCINSNQTYSVSNPLEGIAMWNGPNQGTPDSQDSSNRVSQGFS
jgi:hypothetical protein